jgi:hypothetical protein
VLKIRRALSESPSAMSKTRLFLMLLVLLCGVLAACTSIEDLSDEDGIQTTEASAEDAAAHVADEAPISDTDEDAAFDVDADKTTVTTPSAAGPGSCQRLCGKTCPGGTRRLFGPSHNSGCQSGFAVVCCRVDG